MVKFFNVQNKVCRTIMQYKWIKNNMATKLQLTLPKVENIRMRRPSLEQLRGT